jgi:hypothetical protein
MLDGTAEELVIVRTIQTAGVEVDEHEGFVLAKGVMGETILTGSTVQFSFCGQNSQRG